MTHAALELSVIYTKVSLASTPDKDARSHMSLESYLFTVGQGTLLSTQKFLNGNAPGSTGQYLFLRGMGLESTVRLSFMLGLDYCEVVPGLYNRGPGSMSHVGGDDLWSLAACSMKRAIEIDKYLTKNFGCYNVHAPNQATFINWEMFEWKKPYNIFKHVIGRHLGLWAHIKVCASKMPNILLRFAWCMGVRAAIKSKSQDAIIQSYMAVYAYKGMVTVRSKMMDKAVAEFDKAAPKLSDTYSAYIGDPDHPLVIAARSLE